MLADSLENERSFLLKRFSLSLFLALAALGACNGEVNASTVDSLKAAPQTLTLGSSQSITISPLITVLRLSASSSVNVWGIANSQFGQGGRTLFITNVGTANVVLLRESASAAAADRFAFDTALSSITLAPNGVGTAIAFYDIMAHRWRVVPGGNVNTSFSPTITGDLYVSQTASFGSTLTAGNTILTGAGGTNRLTLKSTTSGNGGSTVRWQNSAAATLWSMGPDFLGNGGQNFWLYDNQSSQMTKLYVDNAGNSYMSFGIDPNLLGGIQYTESKAELGFYAADQWHLSSLVRLKMTSAALKIGANPFYMRRSTSTPLPTLGSNCGGSTTASFDTDGFSTDQRGLILLGTNASACTLTFSTRSRLNSSDPNSGFPICTAGSGTVGQSVAVTSATDQAVTFSVSPAVVGAKLYYRCDNILSPSL
jgi:hypothetical protein